MKLQSSRFSRMAYARRAALLADELDAWYAMYKRRRVSVDPWLLNSSQRSALEERINVLQRIIVQLQDISSELVALR